MIKFFIFIFIVFIAFKMKAQNDDLFILKLSNNQKDTLFLTYFYNPFDSLTYSITYIQKPELNYKINYNSVQLQNLIPTFLTYDYCFYNGWILYSEEVNNKALTYLNNLYTIKNYSEYKTFIDYHECHLLDIIKVKNEYKKVELEQSIRQRKEYEEFISKMVNENK